mgnify:CR=1 FL=1
MQKKNRPALHDENNERGGEDEFIRSFKEGNINLSLSIISNRVLSLLYKRLRSIVQRCDVDSATSQR